MATRSLPTWSVATPTFEREAAAIERERARLKERRGMDERLRELLDAEDGSAAR